MCRNGHEWLDPVMVKGPDGVRRPACRQCRREAVKRVRLRQKYGEMAESQAPAMYSPRKAATPEMTLPQPRTVPIFTRLPAELRDRVAYLRMGDRDDLVVSRAVEKIARSQVIVGVSEGHAAAIFLASLVEAFTDSRHPRYRVDRVLHRLLTAGEG
jgi:hypothetical protein